MDVLFILIFISVGDLSIAVFKGIRMCEKECQLSKHCSAVTFDPIHLRCALLSTVSPSADGLVLRVRKDSRTSGLLQRCLDTLLLNRRGQSVCVPVQGTCYEDEKTPLPQQKLLIHPYNSHSRKAFEMDMKTHSIHEYSFPWTQVRAAAPFKSKMFLAIDHSIVFANAVYSIHTFVKESWDIYDVRTDEEKALIFIRIIVSKKTEIKRFTSTRTRPPTTIFSKNGNLKMSFDLDKKEQRVYVSVAGSILMLSYDGKSKDTFTPKMKPKLIACDPTSGIVYFASSSKLLRLMGRKVQVLGFLRVFSIFQNVLSLRAQDELIYMTVEDVTDYVYMYRLSTRRMKKFHLPSIIKSEYSLALI